MGCGRGKSFGIVCCVPGCKNNSRFNRNVSFHKFPKDETTMMEWVRRVNRKGYSGKFSRWWPAKTDRICGAHFNESGKKKYEDKLPCIFPHKTYACRNLPSTSKRIAGQFTPGTADNDVVDFPQHFEDTPKFDVPIVISNNQSFFVADFEIGADVFVKASLKDKHAVQHCIQHGILEETSLMTGDVLNPEANENLYDHTYSNVGWSEPVIYNLKKSLDDVMSSNLELMVENKNLLEEVNTLKQQLKSLQNECKVTKALLKVEQSKSKGDAQFTLNSILHDNRKVKFYTGFESKCRLELFLNFVLEGYNLMQKKRNTKTNAGRPKVLDVRNELFVVLCRLRLGLLAHDLAHRFQVSESTINNIWQFWIGFLSSYLVQVPIWPSRKIVNDYMPKEFKKEYPSTRVILDCTELFIENPSEFRVQSDTYSSYKSHNTAKGLLGITPNGFVSFVSDLAPGRVSDKLITKDSGIYQKLEAGDSVMADRGFVIEDSLSELGVGLNIPPFLRGKEQLSANEIETTARIAKLRIHVERVIREVKQFRILKYVFPNSMADKLNSIWKICCYLNNFINEPLLDRKPKNIYDQEDL